MNISTILSIALFVTCLYVFLKFSNVETFNNNKKNLAILGSVSLQDNSKNKDIYDQLDYFVTHPPKNYHIISTNSTSGLIGYILDNLKDKSNVTTYTSQKLNIPLNHDYKIKTFGNDDRFENHLIDDGSTFVALPGGIGTSYELLFVLFHILSEGANKKLYILNVDGYYDILLQYLNKISTTSAFRGDMLDKLKTNVIVKDNMKDILDQL